MMGSQFFGGILALIHSIMMIAFNSNVWTPKVDSDEQITNLFIALAELSASIILSLKIKPEMPLLNLWEKDE
jgi:hypothetical protein